MLIPSFEFVISLLNNSKGLFRTVSHIYELLTEIVINQKPLTVFAKSSLVDVWLGSEHVTDSHRILKKDILKAFQTT